MAWIAFHDHVEAQLGPGCDLAPIIGFAAKAAEHAARIAGVITIIEDIDAKEIGIKATAGALELADWYINEALRIQQSGITDPRLRRAAELLKWLQGQPQQTATFSGILQFGPNQLRLKAVAEEALAILAAHGWITEASSKPRTIKAVAI
jgi:Protein of unknown function (DUF3987)